MTTDHGSVDETAQQDMEMTEAIGGACPMTEELLAQLRNEAEKPPTMRPLLLFLQRLFALAQRNPDISAFFSIIVQDNIIQPVTLNDTQCPCWLRILVPPDSVVVRDQPILLCEQGGKELVITAPHSGTVHFLPCFTDLWSDHVHGAIFIHHTLSTPIALIFSPQPRQQ